jgi:uncharacterized protein (DUF4415 family)
MAAAELDAMSDAEDAEITADALTDPDSQPADALTKRLGRPPAERPKVHVNLRLDQDVVDRLRLGGRGWQTRANALLRRGVGLK